MTNNKNHIPPLTAYYTGVWSCPVTTGDRPPPCYGFTFTAIDDRRAVVFGGFNLEMRRMDTVYIIDLITMVLIILSKSLYITVDILFRPDLE